MSISDGMGEHWGSYFSSVYAGLGWLKKIIIKIIKKAISYPKHPIYIDVKIKIPVKQLSIVKPETKFIDASKLTFVEEQMASEDIRSILKPKKK